MNREIESIVVELEAMSGDKEAQMFIVVDNGFDESGLVGTQDAYLRLAKSLLEFVVSAQKGELEEWNLDEKLCPGSTKINDVFDSRCEVVIDTTSLTQTAQQAQEIMLYFRQRNS